MDNNIALISALFNERGANFYKDIYFPIIRYSLISMFNENERNERYFRILDLQEYIKNKFFIEIPVIVLRNSVVALRGKTQANIVVETFGAHDDSVYIEKIENNQENDAINREAESIEDAFSLLEKIFQQYLSAEQLDCNTNLYDFISECEEECYAMIVGDDASHTESIDANYSNTSRFIGWLKVNRPDLYQYFTDIVWGAIVSAFLHRKQFEFSIKPNEKVSYYLDSALVLALFNLDTEYNVAYAKDVMHNVQASGGILKVHGMTLREVSRILVSVINDQGPRFGSAIAYGVEENKLELSDIVNLKNTLERKLSTDFGIVVEQYNQQKLDDAERKLDKNKNVLYLKEKWGGAAQDNFREKHDIFMCETVTKINEGVIHPEKMMGFFITLNRDLIELYHKSDGLSSVITPGNAVLKLWIHGAQNTNIRECVLTEMISRSMALAQTDARRKIKLFCKYRKNTDISAQDISDMYSSLIYRSNSVIMKFNELELLEGSDIDNKDAAAAIMMNGILEGAHQESEQRHRLFEEHMQVKKKMVEDMSILESSIKEITKENDKNEKIIEELRKADSNNQLVIQQLNEELDRRRGKEELAKKLHSLQLQKDEMQRQRNKSITVISFWLIMGLDVLLLLVLVFFMYILVKKWHDGQPIVWNLDTILASVSLLGFLCRVRDAYWLKPKVKYAQCKKEQTDYWENKHPEYSEINKQISEIEKEIKALNFNRT